ncbi:hypothetical protein BY996DRAFT_8371424 [Phakopsora pachyrhizi]|nr:hypothetical protein BY996DRAFT_8371424 [Phakopsora pachyrhizi]
MQYLLYLLIFHHTSALIHLLNFLICHLLQVINVLILPFFLFSFLFFFLGVKQ